MKFISILLLSLLSLPFSAYAPFGQYAKPAALYAANGDPGFAEIEIGYGLRRGVMNQLWLKECSKRLRCPRGGAGELTPFQIKPSTANSPEIRCESGWDREDSLPSNAKCAGKILRVYIDYCKSEMKGIGRYNSGECKVKGTYAQVVYMRSGPFRRG